MCWIETCGQFELKKGRTWVRNREWEVKMRCTVCESDEKNGMEDLLESEKWGLKGNIIVCTTDMNL